MTTANELIKVSAAAQKLIIEFAQATISRQEKFSEMRTKMEVIDIAYARHKQSKDSLDSSGVDNSRSSADTCCGNVFGKDNIVSPVVVSQVDSYTAYLADIFLSGYPLFPVVSPPSKRSSAEKLEVLMDDHAILGGYVRQLLMMLRNGIKYNLSALEVNWAAIEQFSVMADFTNDQGRKVDKTPKFYNALKNLDMYNVIWDYSVAPGDVAKEGDYAGYIELVTKTKLKRHLNGLSNQKKGFNHKEALLTHAKYTSATGMATSNYNLPPTISEYVNAGKGKLDMDWDRYFGVKTQSKDSLKVNLYDGSVYEKFTLYARILPSDLGINAPMPNTPQIWKFVIVNMDKVIEAERIISAYDYLPILFGQPLEDGLHYQTQSVAEGAIPFQEAASTLYNIRFAAARRAVSDRALYDADLINPSDVNSPVPAAKIPVRMKALSGRGLSEAYQQIPFDMRGTETTLSDARTIVGFAQELSGLNGPQRGQFQAGNKSVQEWQDTLAGSDNRLRLPAILYECQVFTPLKQIMALNIFQYGDNAQVVSQRTGEVVDVNIDELRKEVLSFRIADGYTPKSKLASTEILMAGMNMIMNSPILQQQYGASLPNLFAHMMQLGGARDFDQYSPQAQTAPVANNLEDASLQEVANVDPATGAPIASDAPNAPVQA